MPCLLLYLLNTMAFFNSEFLSQCLYSLMIGRFILKVQVFPFYVLEAHRWIGGKASLLI